MSAGHRRMPQATRPRGRGARARRQRRAAAGRRGHRPGTARLPGAGHCGGAGRLRSMGQRPGGLSGDGEHRLRGCSPDRGRPVPLEGAGLGRGRIGVRLERAGPLRDRTGPNERVARLLDPPGPIREACPPPSGAGPVDPVARALTPAPYLRRAFTADQPVTSARLYVTAHRYGACLHASRRRVLRRAGRGPRLARPDDGTPAGRDQGRPPAPG